jgi:hypothetical protein
VLSRQERLWRAAGGAVLAVSLAAAFVWTPERFPLPSCLFRELTGVSCLTCGLTRSVHAMSHGEPLAALRFHLMGPLLFAAAIVTGGIWAVEALRGSRVRFRRNVGRTTVALLGVVWAGYWVARLVSELS